MGLILVRNWSVSANFGVHKLLKEVAQRVRMFVQSAGCGRVAKFVWLLASTRIDASSAR